MLPGRRRLLGLTLAAGLPAWRSVVQAAVPCGGSAWEQWDKFARRHLQADGRVIDFSVANQQTTSEGQSYAMLFALVANDPENFARLWRWSRDNLGAGSAALPAWQWGRRDNGSYGVLDGNSASDADLWMAYALLEAARLWHVPAYDAAGMALLAQVKDKEMVELPQWGTMLLPGPQGFASAEQWRLNLSYLPLPLLRRLARADRAGPWQKLIGTTQQLLRQSAPLGYAPDWSSVDAHGAVTADAVTHGIGSYDAIRIYLWAGLTDPADPLAQNWRDSVAGMLNYLGAHGLPPEQVDSVSGKILAEPGPWGFSAALLPYLQAAGQETLLRQQLEVVQKQWSSNPDPGYYNSVLALFGWGWLQGRYRFNAGGDLLPAWQTCSK